MDECRRERWIASRGFRFGKESLPAPSPPPDDGEDSRRDCQPARARCFSANAHSKSSHRTGENRCRPRTRRTGCVWDVGANSGRERGREGVAREKRNGPAGGVSRALRRAKHFCNEMFWCMLKGDTRSEEHTPELQSQSNL